MVKHPVRNIIIVLILVGVLGLLIFNIPFAIVDSMQFYDDFAFEDTSKWTISEYQNYNYGDGYLRIVGQSPHDSNKNVERLTSFTSTKEFGTEDIKIKYNFVYSYCTDCGGGSGSMVSPKIEYAGYQLPLNIQCSGPRGGYKIYDCAASGTIEVIRYDDFDLTKFVVLDNKGVESFTGTNEEPSALTFYGGHLEIDYVKFQPYYSCEINPDFEVVVRDTFTAGSTVSLNTLTYLPTKFCPQDLGVLIFSDAGLTDEKGSITESLAKGKEFIIDETCEGKTDCLKAKYIQVDYITDYVDDMTERCGVGEAYDTRTKQCTSVAMQEVPTETLLFCNEDDDCLVPPQCKDTTGVCVDNQCDYTLADCTQEQIINYVEVIKTVIVDEPRITQINDGVFEISFSDNKVLAGHDFTSTEPIPLKDKAECQISSNNYLSPSTLGCYRTSINWGGVYTGTLENGEEIILDGDYTLIDGTKVYKEAFLKVEYTMTGRGVYRGTHSKIVDVGGECDLVDDVSFDYEYIKKGECYEGNDDYQNNFKVTFINALIVDDIKYNEKVLLNSDAKVEAYIKNNLELDLIDAGFKTKLSKGARDIFLPTEDISETFIAKDTKAYTIDLDTSEIGVNTLSISPYFNILGSNLYINNQVTLGYYISNDPNIIDCSVLGCAVGTCQSDGTCLVQDLKPQIPSVPSVEPVDNNILIFAGVGALFLVLIISLMLFLRRRK